ncbi:MAG: hypothetical protein WBF51_04320 [Candidatus Dormiibacterota bacterium]
MKSSLTTRERIETIRASVLRQEQAGNRPAAVRDLRFLLDRIDLLERESERWDRQARRQGDKIDAAWDFLQRLEYGWCRAEDREADIAALRAALEKKPVKSTALGDDPR